MVMKFQNFSNRTELHILYMSDGELTSLAEERLVSLTTCEAIIWLNESGDEVGTFLD
jgi:hypothetical protein